MPTQIRIQSKYEIFFLSVDLDQTVSYAKKCLALSDKNILDHTFYFGDQALVENRTLESYGIELDSLIYMSNTGRPDTHRTILNKKDPRNFPKQRTDVPPFYLLPDGSLVSRNPCPVPPEKADWDTPWSDYSPTDYTAQVVIDNDITTNPKGWADPHGSNGLYAVKPNNRCVKEEIETSEMRVAQMGVNRAAQLNESENIKLRFSHTGPMRFDAQGFPLNPLGRTGLDGRGFLGNWGPNHAADPVVCRIYKHSGSDTAVLQFVLIKRKDNGQWALPGGMVEAGQTIAATRTREFAEEAMAYDIKEGESTEEHKFREKVLQAELKRMFDCSVDESDVLYKGVVDDPRNTDKSWMETVAILTLLKGNAAKLRLEAGDDAGKAKWKDYDPEMRLFASHKSFIDEAVYRLQERGILDEHCRVREEAYSFMPIRRGAGAVAMVAMDENDVPGLARGKSNPMEVTVDDTELPSRPATVFRQNSF